MSRKVELQIEKAIRKSKDFSPEEKSRLREITRLSITGSRLTLEEMQFCERLFNRNPDLYQEVTDPIRQEERKKLNPLAE